MIRVSEAQTETKFARLEGKLDLILEQMRGARSESAIEIRQLRDEISDVRGETRSTRTTVLATVLPSALAIAALIIGMFSFYNDVMSSAADERGRARQEQVVLSNQATATPVAQVPAVKQLSPPDKR